MIPKAAVCLLPILWLEVAALWPEFPAKPMFAGQIEQESRWNPRAELKTSRENGVGLSQVTRAYNADGSIRFDTMAELKALHRELKDWTWERRFDPRMGMRAVILKDRDCYSAMPWAADALNRAALSLVCYNSGRGGINQDRQLCRQMEGCNPDKWFGNIEHHSLKNKVKTAGYGKSFFEISREYPRRILFDLAPKYGAMPWKKPT